jgi:DNA-binding phage protein
MKANDIRPLALAREAGVSRQHLQRIRSGNANLRIKTALRIRDACGRLIFRTVGIAEVFDV